jgi:hypothetical protein
MATRTFSITVEDFSEDDVFDAHVKGIDWKFACADFAAYLREEYKYGAKEKVSIEEVRDKFFECLSDRDLKLS